MAAGSLREVVTPTPRGPARATSTTPTIVEPQLPGLPAGALKVADVEGTTAPSSTPTAPAPTGAAPELAPLSATPAAPVPPAALAPRPLLSSRRHALTTMYQNWEATA